MPEKSSSKRKYIRLSGSAWAEIEGLWESGDATLQDLEQRYGVSRRSLQTHFAKRGIVKGAQAAQLAAAVKQQVFTENLADPDLITNRAVETRETAYRNAVVIEGLIMGQLDIAQKDPLLALRAAGAIKGLTLAAAGLERLHALKWRALGLDKDSLQGDELPVLVFEDLTPAEITAIQQGGEADDFDDPASSTVTDGDDNEVIFENCNDGEDDGRTDPPVAQTGPRLVRGAT